MDKIEQNFSAADTLNAAELFIDLNALKKNYQKLSAHCRAAVCSAVVKADAYGLGLEKIAHSLSEAGCTHFFVAHPLEAEELRRHLPKAEVMVLNGLYEGAEGFYTENNIIPVLNTSEQLEAWAAYGDKKGEQLPALLNFDTGMNRLGFDCTESGAVFGNKKLSEKLDILYVMSHLACADTPENEKNAAQLKAFQKVLEKHPQIPASFANSAGIFLGAEYHFNMTRPGYALYGGKASSLPEAEMSPVVYLHTQFLQVREVKTSESVGYGATWTAERDSIIGILPIGYGDGFARLHGSPSGEIRGSVSLNGKKAPIIGRVSMDLMAVDITELELSSSLRNMSVEIIGENITIDDLAESAQTIGYEVLTGLGKRYARHYGDKI